MNLISLSQWAIDNRMSRQRAYVLAQQGRIIGAIQIGTYWAVPKNASRKIGRVDTKEKR